MSIEEGITIQKTEKKEESLEELIDYMFFKSEILKTFKMAIQLMTVGQKNTLTTELRLVKKRMEGKSYK